MRIRPGARTAVEGLTLLACAALGFYLLLSGRVHLFVGTIITTLLWVACPVPSSWSTAPSPCRGGGAVISE